MKSENRHYTKKWQKKRENKGGCLCGNAQCIICHSDKVCKIPTRQQLRAREREEIEYYELLELENNYDR